MKRAGFTMIELIFVIVILGILAAVAIPKLAATRDDAKVAKGASELATLVSDIGAYYTSKGTMATSLNTMSNVLPSSTADMNATATTVTYEPCITISPTATVVGGPADGISMVYTTSTDPVCKGIASAAGSLFGEASGWAATADANLTHSFGGSSVSW